MSPPPAQPKIYHITHVDNLPSILGSGCLWSDARRLQQKASASLVGIDLIKMRRLKCLEVRCHPGTRVGEYVPFNFCPRSVMLYILHRQNHPDLSYTGGQDPILHLQADLHATVAWADGQGVRWAFTRSNAGARFTHHYKKLEELRLVDWSAVQAGNWSTVKDAKQAEFLVYESFPWSLVERVGVHDPAIKARVDAALSRASDRPLVEVRRDWYY